jgi:hypothetical protein
LLRLHLPRVKSSQLQMNGPQLSSAETGLASTEDFAASQRRLMAISQSTGTAFSSNANLFFPCCCIHA